MLTSHSTRPFYTPRRFALLCIKRPVNSNVRNHKDIYMSRELPKNTLELLNDWHRRVRESQHAHYEAAKGLSGAHYWLGGL